MTTPVTIASQITGVQPMAINQDDIFKFIYGFNGHNKKYWPYQIKLDLDKLLAAERWCYVNFKSRNWRNVGGSFAFKRQEDYEWFLLRWA